MANEEANVKTSQATGQATGKSGTRRKILMIGAVIALVGVLYFVYQWLFFVKTDNAQIGAKTVMISAKVSGYVTKVNFDENQKVKKDEVLAEIDSRDYENALHQVEGEVASAEVRAKDAERNYRRLSDLFSKGAVSQQQFDTAQANAREASRRFQAVQAQVEQAKLNLTNTKIRAPSDGAIARKSAEVGMLASVGTPLFGFVSSEERWVVANFKETELRSVAPGKKVDVEVDALPSREFHGVVESVSPATGATFTLLPPDNATGNFTKVVQRVPVRIKLQELTAKDIDLLQAGLSAEVKVHVR